MNFNNMETHVLPTVMRFDTIWPKKEFVTHVQMKWRKGELY